MGKFHVAIAVLAGCILQWILSFADSLFPLYVITSNDLGNGSRFLFITPLIGIILGCSVFCFLSEIIGRKKTLVGIVLTLITSCVAGLIFKYNKEFVTLCLIGITQGMSFGGNSAVLPIYLSEITEKFSGGMFISISQSMFILTAIMLGNVISFVEIDVISDIINYVSTFLGLLTFLTFGFLATESPLYHIRKGRERSAQIALKELRNVHNDTQLELNDLQGTTEDRIDSNIDNEKVMICLQSNGFKKAVVTMFSLTIFHSLCGVHLIPFYLSFKPFALSSLYRSITSGLLGGLCFLSSLVCAFAVDRIGRKICLLISFGGMAASTIYFCVIRALMSHHIINESPVFYIAFPLLFFAAYTFGAGPIPSIFMAELFPLKTKMLMSAIITVSSAVLKIATIQVAIWNLHLDTCLYINIISCIIALIVIHFLYLETSQKSLHEIQLALKKF